MDWIFLVRKILWLAINSKLYSFSWNHTICSMNLILNVILWPKNICQKFNFLFVLDSLTNILYNICTDKCFIFLHTIKRVNFIYFNIKDFLCDVKIKNKSDEKSEKFLEINLKIYKINALVCSIIYKNIVKKISNFFQ